MDTYVYSMFFTPAAIDKPMQEKSTMKCLIVSSRPDIIRTLRHLLSTKDHACTEACSPAELEKLESVQYELCLIDTTFGMSHAPSSMNTPYPCTSTAVSAADKLRPTCRYIIAIKHAMFKGDGAEFLRSDRADEAHSLDTEGSQAIFKMRLAELSEVFKPLSPDDFEDRSEKFI